MVDLEQFREPVDDARMARALEWLRAECGFYNNAEARTHLPAIEEAIAAYNPNCGARTVRLVDDAAACRLDDYLSGEFGIRIGKQAARAALTAALSSVQGVEHE